MEGDQKGINRIFMSLEFLFAVGVAFVIGLNFHRLRGLLFGGVEDESMEGPTNSPKNRVDESFIGEKLHEFIREEHEHTRNAIKRTSNSRSLENELLDLKQGLFSRLTALETKLENSRPKENYNPRPIKAAPVSKGNVERVRDEGTVNERRVLKNTTQVKKNVETAILYTKAPSQAGSFQSKDLTELYDRGRSVYVFHLQPGGMSADVTFKEDEEVIEKMLSFPDDYVKPICEYEGKAPNMASKIRLLKPGKAVRVQNEWRIETKVQIEFL